MTALKAGAESHWTWSVDAQPCWTPQGDQTPSALSIHVHHEDSLRTR